MGDTLGLEHGRFGWRWVLAVAVAAVGIVALLYRLASIAVTLPIRYAHDALLHATYVQRLQEAGWYLDNDRLGAPWGLDAADFPLGGENVHWLALKLIGFVAPTEWAAMNAYFVVTYPLVAVAAFVVLRALRVRASLAAAGALLFAFLPFHQYRGVSHLLRSGYYVVPFLVLAATWVAQPDRFLAPAPGRGRLLGFRRDRVVLLAVLALVAGTNDTQNAAYGVLLVTLLSIAGSLAVGSLRPVLLAVAFAGLVAVSLVANNAPYVHKLLTEGGNSQVAARSMGEQEVYGLRAALLVLPIPEHRIGALASLMEEVDEATAPGERPGQALGAIGALALVSCLLAAGYVLVGRRAAPPSSPVQTAAVCGLLALVAMAVAAPGGFAFVLSALGLTLYRTWNRTSTFIAFASLAGGALLLQVALARLHADGWRRATSRPAIGLLVVALVAVGVLDQTPPSDRLTQSDRTVQAFHADRAFFEAVEAQHRPGAMVFQLPVTDFPEGGATFDLPDYDQLTAYLHTEDLRWSAGAMRGRPASYWQERLSALSTRDQLRAVAAVGFDGIVLHQRGFPDHGAALGAVLDELVGGPTATGGRDLTHHDLTALRASLEASASPGQVAAAGAQLVDPVRVERPPGLGGVERTDGRSFRWSSTDEATYEVVNPADEARTVTFTGWFSHADPDTTEIRVVGPGIDRTLPRDGGPLVWTATVEPGTTELRVTTDGEAAERFGDTRTLGLLHGTMTALGPDARELLCSQPDPEPRPYCPPAAADEAPEPEPGAQEQAP